jgi:AcrR family transcriptional regulator
MRLAPVRPILPRHVLGKHTCLKPLRKGRTCRKPERRTCFSIPHRLQFLDVGDGERETRARLRGALLERLTARDLRSLTDEDLAASAGLPASAVAAEYGNLDNCLVATYDEVSEQLYRGLEEAFEGSGEWHTCVARAVDATFAQLAANPGVAQLCFGEPALRHPRIRRRRAASRQRVVRFLAEQYEREQGRGLPDVHFEFLFGALLRAAQEDVAAGREPDLVAERVRQLLELLEPVPA